VLVERKIHTIRSCQPPAPRTTTYGTRIQALAPRGLTPRTVLSSRTVRTYLQPKKAIRISRSSTEGLTIPYKYDRSTSPKVSFTLLSTDIPVTEYALLDTGCEAYGMMDLEWAKDQGLKIERLREETLISPVDDQDGDRAQIVRYATRCDIQIGDHIERNVVFRLMQIGHCPVILGYPWMETHDPHLRFSEGSLVFQSPYCQKNCNTPGQSSRVRLYTQRLPRVSSRKGRRGIDVYEISFRTASLYATPKY
jgi:hypothetical protein